MDFGTHQLRDIRLRDPFVLESFGENVYYLYGSTDSNTWFGCGTGFDAYRSSDLKLWEGPHRVFSPPIEFWGEENFWAPEVYEVDGRFYMFATFRGRQGRGTAILAGETPLGPFLPHSDGAVTPRGWDALDGTFFVDDEDRYWVVFCQEWQQIKDGKVCARRLSQDLRSGDSEASTLFTASEAPWTSPIKKGCFVADGPFLHRSGDGSLLMLWSSFGAFGYAQGIARSATGDLFGPWKHLETPIWEADGGHGMVFRAFDNELRLILHHPNQTPYERVVLLGLDETRDGVSIKRRLAPVAVVVRRFNQGGSRRHKVGFLVRFVLRQLGALG